MHRFLARFSRNHAIGLNGDRSRPGCCSARPRAEHQGTGRRPLADLFQAPFAAAKVRLTAPEAGALPIPNAWFRFTPRRVDPTNGGNDARAAASGCRD